MFFLYWAAAPKGRYPVGHRGKNYVRPHVLRGFCPERANLGPFEQFSMIFNGSFAFTWFLVNFLCYSMGISYFYHSVINLLCNPIRILHVFIFQKGKKERKNNWRGVTISLRTGGQGHPTPIHTPSPPHIHKIHLKRSLFHFLTRGYGPTGQRTDGQSLL